MSQLQQLLRENADVFALDPGSTDLATHTGDHTPIRQLPRWMPFSLGTKVVELVGARNIGSSSSCSGA